MISRQKFYDQPEKNDFRTYDNIRKLATGQGDDYTTGCLLDYPHFKEHCNLTATDVIKQQVLGAYPKAIQEINLIGNLDRAGNTTMFSLLKKH